MKHILLRLILSVLLVPVFLSAQDEKPETNSKEMELFLLIDHARVSILGNLHMTIDIIESWDMEEKWGSKHHWYMAGRRDAFEEAYLLLFPDIGEVIVGYD